MQLNPDVAYIVGRIDSAAKAEWIDYFMWRVNYEERIKVNEDLDKIKENLTILSRKSKNLE